MAALKERVAANPVIAAVKDEDGLQRALCSDCETVFLLGSTILNVRRLVNSIKEAGKVAIVHIDLVEGLGNREIAVNALGELCAPHGIISTRAVQVRRAAGGGQAGFCGAAARPDAPGHHRDRPVGGTAGNCRGADPL